MQMKVKKTCNYFPKQYIYDRLFVNQYNHDKNNTRTHSWDSWKFS